LSHSGNDTLERPGPATCLHAGDVLCRAIFKGSRDAILLVDAEGIIGEVSDSAATITGVKLRALPGMRLKELFAPVLQGEIDALMARALSGPSVRQEARLHRPGGPGIEVEMHAHGLDVGVVRQLLVSIRDVSEEKRLRREAEYRLKQVVQADKLAALGEIVAGVAHEINNPNSFIATNLPLLEETWQLIHPFVTAQAEAHPSRLPSGFDLDRIASDMEEIIAAIRTGSDRITRVVTHLKEFARPEGGQTFGPLQVNQVIESALTIVGAQVRKCVGTLNVRLAPDLPPISGHFHKLEQVIANLLVNATHAIPERSAGRLEIATRHIERLGAVLIEVEDNGCGLAPEILERIFDPFFTTRREAGGTGLGLSVSHSLVSEHRGRIGVLSRPGRGTRFTVFLPLGEGLREELRPTILCVDDEPAVLTMLGKFFVSIKKMPMEALGEPDAVMSYLWEHPEVDMVFSDLVMPGVSGWELLRRIRADFPLIGVVLFSGDPRAWGDRPEGGLEPDHRLDKPLQLKRLFDIVTTMGRQKL
jgi:PAS domain S-box-containing protein